MKYLIVDGQLHGTGIRDKYTGEYLKPSELNLSQILEEDITEWLSDYEAEHYNEFANKATVEELDKRGEELARRVKSEVFDAKVEYYSNATLKGSLPLE